MSNYSVATTLYLVGPSRWTDVQVELSYNVTDPYAVTLTFPGAVWLFARDLLRTGLERPVGAGDVRLWPSKAAGEAIWIHLNAPSGEALLEASRTVVAAFVKHIYEMVPEDAEELFTEIDTELDELNKDQGGAL